jgi:hypothetical protein
MYRKLLPLALLILLVQNAFPQNSFETVDIKTEAKTETKIETKNENAISAELKKQAVEFLRESAGEVGNLRTHENRISFAAEMASLMWFYDEKQARSMFGNVITDFRQMFMEIDSQVNAAGITAEQAEMDSLPFLPNADPRAKLSKRFAKAMSVRQQIAVAVSEHDPILAYTFFIETAQAVTNPAFKKQFENQDKSLEMKLLQAVGANDAAKGVEMGRKSLAKGFTEAHLELLKKIYSKDADKGAAFGEEIFAKIKSENSGKMVSFYSLRSILKAGAENRKALKENNAQKPMFSDETMREAAEMTAQMILKNNDPEMYGREEAIELIKQFHPARGAQIEQKIFLEKQKLAAAKKAEGSDEDDDDHVSNSYLTAMKEQSKKAEEQEKMMKDLQSLGEKKLPEEEREKVIDQARKMVAEIGDPNAKMMALRALAAQVGKMGDRETALEIMREAERFVNLQPKNYMDFIQNWMLASGYSQIDAEKSFPILEETVFRLNETISAFIKVGEFIDVNGDFIEDGEVQVGSFGGEITRGMMSSIGATDSTILNLAKQDFARTRSLTNRFDRSEVRILAKMLILRAILGGEKKAIEE